MRILFIGSVVFSKKIFLSLIKKKFFICGTIGKKRSDFNTDFYDLNQISKKNNIPFKYTEDINNEKTLNWISRKKPDIIVCCGWSRLLKKKIIEDSKNYDHWLSPF